MKTLLTTLTVALALPVLAHADSYPISGLFSTGISTNHAVFRGNTVNDASYVSTSLGGQVYWTPLPGVVLTASASAGRALEVGIGGQGGNGSTNAYTFEMRNAGLDVNYGIGRFGPVVLSSGLTVTIPLSDGAEAAGLITSFAPRFSATFILPSHLFIALGSNASYNVLDNPTRRLDCARFQDLCSVSGSDTGLANSLWGFSGSFTLAYQPLPWITVVGSYILAGGAKAVDSKLDALSADAAVGGQFFSQGSHRTRFGASFGFAPFSDSKPLSLAEQQNRAGPANPLTLSLSMSTMQNLYSADQTRITVPIFDMETGDQQRTTYNFSARYAF